MEKDIKVTYRKRRTPRTFKVWETAYHHEAIQKAIELRHYIDDLSIKLGRPVSSMEDISVATNATTIFHLVDAYVLAYEALMKEGLIVSGNISKIQPTLQ